MSLFCRSYTRISTILDDWKASIGSDFTVVGIIRTARKQKLDGELFFFVKIRDGSHIEELQLIFDGKKFDLDTLRSKFQTGASMKVKGTIIESPAPGQDVEMKVKKIIDLGEVSDPGTYPLSKKGHHIEHIRMFPELRVRLPEQQVRTILRHGISQAVHKHYSSQGLRWIHTPILTSSDCEGAGEVLSVSTLMKTMREDIPTAVVTRKEKYQSSSGKMKTRKVTEQTDQIDYSKDMFHRRAYLTVSGQLHVEAVACQMGDSYTFGPIFRAEGSDSFKHVAEAWLIEPELWYVELKDLIDHTEDVIKYTITHILSKYRSYLEYIDRSSPGHLKKMEKWATEPFIRKRYSETIDILKEAHESGKVIFENPIEYGEDLGSEHEKYLTDIHFKDSFVVVTHWPKKIKAFYMLESTDDSELCDCFDVLCPHVGELVGGSMREHRYEKVMKTIEERGMDATPLEFYLRLRKFGPMPHGGYGIGLDRLVMLLTGTRHIKEVITFPRSAGSITC